MTEDLSPIDHKGRSRPIYDRRSAIGPARTNRWARLLVGLWPGLRIMAQRSLVAGAPYAILGALLVSQAVLLVSNWPLMEEAVAQYRARDAVLLLPAGLVFASVMAFEWLRLGTSRASNRWPRILASFLLPCAGWCAAAPGLAPLAPRWVEASAFAAAVVAAAAVPAAFACVVDVLVVASPRRLRWTRRAFASMAGLALLTLLVLFLVPHPEAAERARGAGMLVLAQLLS